MHGMILAAGLGTRLRPVTNHLPKALLPVVNIPLIEYALPSLVAAGVELIGVNLCHLGAKVRGFLQQTRVVDPARFVFSSEPELLGTAGGIKRLARILGGESFFIHNADMLASVDARSLIDHHRRSGAVVTLAVAPPAACERPTLALVPDGSVTDMLGLVHGCASEVDFLGLCVIEASFVARLPEHGCLVRDALVPYLREGGRVAAWVHQGYARDVGTPARWLRAQADLLAGRLTLPEPLATRYETACRRQPLMAAETQIIPPVAAGLHTCIAERSTVGPGVCLGEGVRVGRGCCLRHALVLDDTVISDHAIIEHAIVGPEGILSAEEGSGGPMRE
ncbi:MAG: NDP-sugar synthase [Planctomycetota bacterium]